MKIGSGRIVIMDDGTPQVYLDKLLEKYPTIIIEKSAMYEEKIQFTSQGKRPDDYIIPINLWIETAKSASENFILIEDDTWFIDDINLEEIDQQIAADNVVLTKLYWIGNNIINQNRKETQKKNIVLLEPKLFTSIPALYYFIFYKFDRFKIRKTLRLFKIHTDERHLAYYTIYAVAGMIFNKDYFVKLWDNNKDKVDEGLQVYNAVKALNKQKGKIKFARYTHELLRTGFISSATNQSKEKYAGNVDMFVFNKLLNEAWQHGELDTISSLPHDIDTKQIVELLDKNPQANILSKDWISWVENFKSYYINIGCKID